MSNYISNLSNKSYKYSYFRIFVPTDLQIIFEDKHDFRLSLRYIKKRGYTNTLSKTKTDYR
jgi:hypothetical protein